jgi:hypothetical protein
MKNTVWLVVAALMAFSCGPSDNPGEHVRPVSAELSSGLDKVHPTLLCSGGTCRDSRAMELVSTQQGLSTLRYSTYLGFEGSDGATAVAVDPSHNAYVAGCSNLPDGTSGGAFVAKMSPTGQNIYFTYFTGYCIHGIAVDSAGNAYVVGSLSATYAGGSFVAKLNPSGSAFIYYNVVPWQLDGIALDSRGYVYVTGMYNGNNNDSDVYVGKLNLSGSAFIYSVAFGGGSGDDANGIAVDSWGNAYVVGDTSSPDFPLWNAYQSTLRNELTAFVSKLNASGTGLMYSTYLGPGQHASTIGLGLGIAVDGNGSAYVTGHTESNFPVTVGAAQTSFGGEVDVYAAKLNSAGWLVYATYLGGSGGELPEGIAVDSSSGTAYVKGTTYSLNFPVTSTAFQPFYRGEGDTFVTQISASGSSILHSTYLGGSNRESANFAYGKGIALDSSKNVYVSGSTDSTDFPTNVYGHGGNGDAFITKFNGSP